MLKSQTMIETQITQCLIDNKWILKDGIWKNNSFRLPNSTVENAFTKYHRRLGPAGIIALTIEKAKSQNQLVIKTSQELRNIDNKAQSD